MKLLAFAIHDDKVGAYSNPLFSPANGAAIRSFLDAVANTESQMSKHPADYTLYRIGTFDDETGLLSAEKPVQLSTGAELKPRLAL